LNSFLLYRQTKMLLAGWHPLKDERRERKWTFFFRVSYIRISLSTCFFLKM
jgi:hypothetical protein